MGFIVPVNDKGKVVIPKEVGEKLMIEKGSSLILDVKNKAIVLRGKRSSPKDIYDICGEEEVKLEEIEEGLGYQGIH